MNKEKNIKYLFLGVIFLFCMAKSFTLNIPDYDLWARLLVGKHLFDAGTLLKHDIFSYTPTHFWYDHEWGSSFIFYSVHHYFGDVGLLALKGLLIFLIMFLVYKTIEFKGTKYTKSYNIIFYIFMFSAMFAVLSATIRCHIFTFFLFALWLYLLERVRSGEKKWLFYFPFMMIVWNNLHGGCVSGIGLLLIYSVGEFLNKKPIKDYLISLLLTCLATFINPYGPKYVEFLLKATTMKRPLITEWKSTFDSHYIHDYIKFKFFLLVMLFTAFTSLIKEKINYKDIDKTKVLLLIMTAYLSIAHIKHQPFFVIVASVFLYDDFYKLFNQLMTQVRKFLNITSENFISNFVKTKEIIVYSLIIIASLAILNKTDGKIKISQTKYPIYAVEFVKLNKIKGNLFVNFTYGSYTAYKLYPNNLISIDGRYEEVYYDELLHQVKDFHQAKKADWKKLINEYKTDVMILEKEFPVFDKISKDKDWKMVFDDNAFGIFVPSKEAKSKYIYPPHEDSYYDSTKFDTDVQFKKEETFLTKPL